jgi:hypothetical protein
MSAILSLNSKSASAWTLPKAMIENRRLELHKGVMLNGHLELSLLAIASTKLYSGTGNTASFHGIGTR